MALKKYVPRSIQNIFDRLEAFNESITDKLYSEELVKTFEVIVYCSKNPETKTTVSADSADLSPNVANYNFFKARSLAGHHDFLIQPERARSIDEYERLRNLHFQAIIKKSSGSDLPQTGDVWLATQTGANMVRLQRQLLRQHQPHLLLQLQRQLHQPPPRSGTANLEMY